MKTQGQFRFYYQGDEYKQEDFHKLLEGKAVKYEVEELNVIARDV